MCGENLTGEIDRIDLMFTDSHSHEQLRREILLYAKVKRKNKIVQTGEEKELAKCFDACIQRETEYAGVAGLGEGTHGRNSYGHRETSSR